MPFAVIDCGTTNSRIYLLDENYKIIKKGNKKIGVRDAVLHGSNEVLKLGLKKLMEETILLAGLKFQDIKFAIASGMITSEIGLIEIPHLRAPIGISDLAKNIKVVQDKKIFPLNIPLYFIRGIKNYFPENTTYKDIRKVDFMRGEETQVAGLISLHPKLSYPVTIVVLSSHTKYIYINKEKKICSSLTTLSGQIYEAINKNSFIGKSIKSDESEKNENYFNTDVIDTAYDSVRNAGFLRTLMMPRFMEVLLKTKWYERKLFINAAIVAEDLRGLEEFKTLNCSSHCDFVLIGHKIRCKILSYLLKKYYKVTEKIKCIYKKEEIDQLSIGGGIAIAETAGYLKKN